MKTANRGQNKSILLALAMILMIGTGFLMTPEQACAATVTTNVKGTLTLQKGKSTALYVKNAGKVTWKSQRTSIATVTSSGKVTAKAVGTARITAKTSSRTYNCTISVTAAKATVTTNVKGTISLAKGKTTTLYVKNAGTVKWKSSKTSVATVSSAGKVTAKGAGTATITATAGGKKYTCTVKVTAPSGSSAGQDLGLNTNGMNSADAAIFKKMYAKKSQYYEGMRWTNANYYQWKGGIFAGGYGCSGFAFMLSDVAFGTAQARQHYDFNNVKVGDILRINNNSHSVMVMKVVGNNFVVAEGNYNSSIHWGRVISRSTAKSTGTYVMTRR